MRQRLKFAPERSARTMRVHLLAQNGCAPLRRLSAVCLCADGNRVVPRSRNGYSFDKINTEESPAGQDCTATKGELPFEATRRSRRILQAGFFFLKFPCKIFHKSRKICKMGMGKYPPGELVIPVDSGTIGFSSKAENA